MSVEAVLQKLFIKGEKYRNRIRNASPPHKRQWRLIRNRFSTGADKASDRWYNILQAKLSERFPAICFPVVNGAVGGESTRECMARFDREVLAYNPDYCLFMIGGNNHDCSRPERTKHGGHIRTYNYLIPSPCFSNTRRHCLDRDLSCFSLHSNRRIAMPTAA